MLKADKERHGVFHTKPWYCGMSGKHSLTKSVLFKHAIKALLHPLTRTLIAEGMTAPQLYRFVKQSYVDTG